MDRHGGKRDGRRRHGRLCHRVKRYWEEPGWNEIYPTIQAIRTELWDAIDQYPGSGLLKEYYRQVLYLLKRS